MIKTIIQNDGFMYRHALTEKPPFDFNELHTHSFYELLYILSGDVTHVVENRKYKLKRNDLVIIRPFDSHYVQVNSDADYERLNILFDGEALGITNSSFSDGLDVIHAQRGDVIYDNFRKIERYSLSMPSEAFLELAPFLVKEIIYNISASSDNLELHEALTTSPIISNALEYISDNLLTIRDVKEISDAVFVTESYLYRLFKNELRQTPKKYIMQKRLLYAERLILSGEKPTEIYAECGFGDYTSFYRNYTASFGHPPSEKGRRKISFLD